MNLFAVPAVVAAAYHAFAFWASLRRLREPVPNSSSFTPPVSILKPVRGKDAYFAEAIASHAAQDYPDFEILFGITDPDDPARALIEALALRYPERHVRLFVVATDAPNGKVGVLEKLAAEARHPVLLVSDSDIFAPPHYLRDSVAPLREERTGMVTCLYRARGESFAARSEALGIATEFGPSVLVAREVGVKEFAMGSTLVFRARDLARIGGFASFRDYLADDYQLGKRISALELGVVLAHPVVETHLGAGNWRDVWKHQLRWSRTVRVSRPVGYYGYVVTHATWWALVALLTGSWKVALATLAIRMLSGLWIASRVLHDGPSVRFWWWMPIRDLFGFAIWVVGLWGDLVEWRGQTLIISQGGRIQPR